VGNIAAQEFGLITGTQSNFSFQELGTSAILGGVGGGFLLRPYTAPNQMVTSWAPKGATADLQPGRWVMTGQATPRNLKLTGTDYPLSNSISQEIPSSQLAYPSGWESVKGLIGQRIIK
jgi:hypothetical protein